MRSSLLAQSARGLLHKAIATKASRGRLCVRAGQPCVVLSNDDGIESKALQSLAAKLRGHGHRVVVVAPDRNKSAASMGLTLRTNMTLEARPELGPDTYALSGTPTDCMMVTLDATKGLMRALDLHPVLALSGPNYGPNMGTDVLLSGTVGAARTAGLYGVPAIAASSTSLDRHCTLDNCVDVMVRMAELALQLLHGKPARNWPRNHIITGSPGRRHVNGSCEYESLPAAWVMDLEQALTDAFMDGDVFLNVNVPKDWQPGAGRMQTTGIGLMFYRDSYVVAIPGAQQQQGAAAAEAPRQPAMAAASTATAGAVAAVNGNGAGNGNGAPAAASASASSPNPLAWQAAADGRPPSVGVEEITAALAAGRPVVYNNAFDTRRLAEVERSDVLALQAGDVSISTLQTWPEGHTLCLSDRVMSRALLSAHDGTPSWLHGAVEQSRRSAAR